MVAKPTVVMSRTAVLICCLVASSCTAGGHRQPPPAFQAARMPPPPVFAPPATSTFTLSRPPGPAPTPASANAFFGLPLEELLRNLPVPALPWIPGAAGNSVPALSFVPGTCGEVFVGARSYPVDCMTPDYANIPWAAVAVIPRWVLGRGKGFAGAASLPELIDHRQEGLEGPVRDQGQVGSCTGASLTSVIDQAIAVETGATGDVSFLHVWSRYHTPSMEKAANANLRQPVAGESAWAYDDRTACSWFSPCEPGRCSKAGVNCGSEPDSARIQQADAMAEYKISEVVRLADTQTDTFREVLTKGKDIWFAMLIDQKVFSGVRGSNATVPDFDARRRQTGHAMALAGYKTQSDGTYFLLKNSWGADWGDQGYAWIHEDTLQRNIYLSGYVVSVERVGGVAPPGPNPRRPPTPRPPARPPAACPGGLTPDSVSGRCTPACPDGSPRALGYCPDVQRCPPGYVNLFGVCTVAPASTQGVDPQSGVGYRCGSGGCTYSIPTGQFGCTSSPHCLHACPAPAYALAVGPGGVSCTE